MQYLLYLFVCYGIVNKYALLLGSSVHVQCMGMKIAFDYMICDVNLRNSYSFKI